MELDRHSFEINRIQQRKTIQIDKRMVIVTLLPPNPFRIIAA